jgi:hypothetical protein
LKELGPRMLSGFRSLKADFPERHRFPGKYLPAVSACLSVATQRALWIRVSPCLFG